MGQIHGRCGEAMTLDGKVRRLKRVGDRCKDSKVILMAVMVATLHLEEVVTGVSL